MDINKDIVCVLWNSVIAYKDKILKVPTIKEQIINDPNCDNVEEDYNYFVMFYLIRCLAEKGGFKMLYQKLIDGGIDKKIVNKFLYSLLKLDYKTEKGMFSFNEIEEWELPYDVVKKTTQYKFF